MVLISKKILLQGVSSDGAIEHKEWAAQAKHKFGNYLLKEIFNEGFKIITITDSHIMFKTYETAGVADGQVNPQSE